jgi:hypothetical protein
MYDLHQQPDVIYHGPQNHFNLAMGYLQAGFLLYPSLFTNTGCIAVMKAMIPWSNSNYLPTERFSVGAFGSRVRSSSEQIHQIW